MSRDPFQIFISSLVTLALIGAALWILSPFAVAILWATMIAVACWPLFLRLEARLGRRRWLAVTAMVFVMLAVFVLPFVAAVATLVQHTDEIVHFIKLLSQPELPPPPAWVQTLPLIGPRAHEWWTAAQGDPQSLVARALPYLGKLVQWLVGHASGVGLLVVNILLTIVLATVMFANGEAAADHLRRAVRRLGGARGEQALQLSAMAIRGVALGVVVTALIQATFAGIGLWIADVPLAGLLTAAMFLLAIAQIGVGPVMIPATIWLYWNGDTLWGTVLLVWTAIALTMDNVLRPWLIKRGADLPLLLIFAGVVGGLLTMGLLGIFIGPTLLAVAFMLFDAWLDENDTAKPPAPPPAT
ncbi:MAG: AI-2E family transporter YdiK [Betaproteobacteria bacterium]